MANSRHYALILLVEDDDRRVGEFMRWFAAPDVRLLWVRTGDAALRCVETECYDLILLDHDLDLQHPRGHLGKVSGTNVVDRLIASSVNRRTPIIIHSMNPGARNNMYLRLRANKFDVEIRPFSEWSDVSAQKVLQDLRAEWVVSREN